MPFPFPPPIPAIATATAVAASILAHAAPFLGQSAPTQLACAIIQAPAIGIVLATAAPPPWRWLGIAIPAVLLAGIAAGATRSPETALLAAAGLTHAMLYVALLAIFARSLRPRPEAPQDAIVTRMARLANPAFHPGMVPYTRKVTAAWCVLFAAQLAISALLLAPILLPPFLLTGAPTLWPPFVSGWHAAAIPALMLAELLVRRIRFRHEQPTGLRATLQAIRAVRRSLPHKAPQDVPANRSTIP